MTAAALGIAQMVGGETNNRKTREPEDPPAERSSKRALRRCHAQFFRTLRLR
jgi:hypothetical protein